MTENLMNYEAMTQTALLTVVRNSIRRVIREDGLPGSHHFYITFATKHPEADVDEGLANKYPDEITIVLEHQYWDLQDNTTNFEVTLKFGGIPKYIKVPYKAITRFHDPSVGFTMQFEPDFEKNTTEYPKAEFAITKDDQLSVKETNNKGMDNVEKVVKLDAFRKK
ncbi:ClpXP protease specificity-enhancing factor SspB [Hellea sp.]|jgi:hypothetical protein|nr:ClpXP protease specificity-enhancing factor SspB [Hellea sp.]MBT3593495.1 hypothetical protein [Hellea sp.]MDA8888508.1 ClpXP protease specificity-enhancing factor SspB [Hellea sp.]MDB4845450.1 ClpXP protease specificity-enhancing factor SspB [Hellea sp.]MDC0422164.1 ClpXP protease specificity-enhancing factor SspB [Hellea sp.]MDC1089103.1 ClpXP protease specificity-enhancing factor SspB [Hellea sp.]